MMIIIMIRKFSEVGFVENVIRIFMSFLILFFIIKELLLVNLYVILFMKDFILILFVIIIIIILFIFNFYSF